MNYYIQGNAAKADKIKAAFKAKGINTDGWEFININDLYFSVGDHIYTIDYSIKHIITGRHDYQELELSNPHYDISNFKPFDKVLVRDNSMGVWCCSFYSHYARRSKLFYCAGDGNERLLGTTDPCGEEYINW